jgi:class 3 adenylate cyclase
MDFYAVVAQVIELLRSREHVSYRALKLQLQLDDETIEALKDELIYAQRVAVDEERRVLVWTGGVGATPAPAPTPSASGPSDIPRDLPVEVAPRPVDTRPPEAERRQLTVLFCDLVGSTQLSGQLDPEDWREVVRAYQETAAAVIEHFEGHIAQYLGGGLLVYCGYPRARGDDAQRAVHTGLGIVDAMGTLNGRLQAEDGVALAVRLGIHTGPVVVGAMGSAGRHEHLALGETPNIAARLEALAAPNTVVISAVTAQLVQRAFALESLGTQALKGITAPMGVWRVVSPLETLHEVTTLMPEDAKPLVGRGEEVGLILRRWEQSKAGQGQVVLISHPSSNGNRRMMRW